MGFYLPEYVPLMDSVCSAGFGQGFFGYNDWIGTSLIALTFSLMVIVFMYMIAAFFQKPDATANAKLELYELAVTAAIFVVVFLLLNGMCSVKTGWIFPGAGATSIVGTTTSWADKSIYYSASNYLMEFADDTLGWMSAQYGLYMFIDFVTSMELSSTPMGIGATMRPTSGLGAVVKPVLNNAFTAEAVAVVTTQAQVYVMDFGTYALLKYLLPIGLVLRSWIMTRRIGGTLIALTMTFLFIYPLIIIPTYAIVNDSLMSSIGYVKGAAAANVFNAMTVFKLFLELTFKWIWGPDFLLGYALLAMPVIAKVFIGGVFMPLFTTLIAVTTVRYLSRALGEEIDITNLTRMI